MKKFTTAILVAIIFFTPSNLFYKLYEQTAFVHNLQIDYLIPKLYITDILILIFLLYHYQFWIKLVKTYLKTHHFSYFKKHQLQVLFIFVFFLRQLITTHPLSSSLTTLKLVLLILFATWLRKEKQVLTRPVIKLSITITTLFQSLLALYQYTRQTSLLPYLFLGETQLNQYAGITKATIFGVEKILPYGTTAHPNVLAGFLTLTSIYLLQHQPNWLEKIVIILAILVTILTQSLSALIILLVWLLTKQLKIAKKVKLNQQTLNGLFFTVIILIIPVLNQLTKLYPDNTSLVRRNYLNLSSLVMIKHNLLFGVGVNNFTAHLEQYGTTREVVRFVQPVHHIFLLLLAENGLLGAFLLYSLTRKYHWEKLILLLPIIVLDHYLLTINTGMLLLLFSSIYLSQNQDKISVNS